MSHIRHAVPSPDAYGAIIPPRPKAVKILDTQANPAKPHRFLELATGMIAGATPARTHTFDPAKDYQRHP